MKKKKTVVTANIKTREDFSNPYRHLTHEEQMKRAGVEKKDPNKARIIELENGMIKIEWDD